MKINLKQKEQAIQYLADKLSIYQLNTNVSNLAQSCVVLI